MNRNADCKNFLVALYRVGILSLARERIPQTHTRTGTGYAI